MRLPFRVAHRKPFLKIQLPSVFVPFSCHTIVCGVGAVSLPLAQKQMQKQAMARIHFIGSKAETPLRRCWLSLCNQPPSPCWSPNRSGCPRCRSSTRRRASPPCGRAFAARRERLRRCGFRATGRSGTWCAGMAKPENCAWPSAALRWRAACPSRNPRC